jgi:hypothetical protein
VAFGFVLLTLGIAALVLGTLSLFEGKRLAVAPFHGTGDVAKDPGVADLRGMISAEGKVVEPLPLRAPCSRRPSVYFEVRVYRHWEKTGPPLGDKRDKSGKTTTGRDEVATRWTGGLFQIDDGSGPVSIDARRGAECDLVKNHEQRIEVDGEEPGELVFGELRMPTPTRTPDGTTTIAFSVVEHVLDAEGVVYACGRLQGGVIGKPSWAALRLSAKGRDALLGRSRNRATLGLALGAMLTAGSIPAFLIVPEPTDATGATGAAPDGTTHAESAKAVDAASPSPVPPESGAAPAASSLPTVASTSPLPPPIPAPTVIPARAPWPQGPPRPASGKRK